MAAVSPNFVLRIFREGDDSGQTTCFSGSSLKVDLLASMKIRILKANFSYTKISSYLPLKGLIMTETVITLRLNQQQLELMDRTIARGVAADRVALVRLALCEYAARRKADAVVERGQ